MPKGCLRREKLRCSSFATNWSAHSQGPDCEYREDIWRFPADPVFLLIGQGKDQAHLLMVITRDGSIWIVPLSKIKTRASRYKKNRKTVSKRTEKWLDAEMWECLSDCIASL